MPNENRLLVIDDFYADPDAVRLHALRSDYYDPDGGGYHDINQAWQDDVLYHPFDGWLSTVREHRYLTEENVSKLAAIMTQPIDRKHWYDGSYWNGGFQVKTNHSRIAIHSHGMANPFNACWPGGWTGIVFLTPNPKPNTGVSIWEHCQAIDDDAWFLDRDLSQWQKLDEVDNVYNRLVVMGAHEYHSGTCGWGSSPADGRLIQTFFFQAAGSMLPGDQGVSFYQRMASQLQRHAKMRQVVYHNQRYHRMDEQ